MTYQLPINEMDRKALEGHYDDFAAAIETNIQVCTSLTATNITRWDIPTS